MFSCPQEWINIQNVVQNCFRLVLEIQQENSLRLKQTEETLHAKLTQAQVEQLVNDKVQGLRDNE